MNDELKQNIPPNLEVRRKSKEKVVKEITENPNVSKVILVFNNEKQKSGKNSKTVEVQKKESDSLIDFNLDDDEEALGSTTNYMVTNFNSIKETGRTLESCLLMPPLSSSRFAGIPRQQSGRQISENIKQNHVEYYFSLMANEVDNFEFLDPYTVYYAIKEKFETVLSVNQLKLHDLVFMLIDKIVEKIKQYKEQNHGNLDDAEKLKQHNMEKFTNEKLMMSLNLQSMLLASQEQLKTVYDSMRVTVPTQSSGRHFEGPKTARMTTSRTKISEKSLIIETARDNEDSEEEKDSKNSLKLSEEVVSQLKAENLEMKNEMNRLVEGTRQTITTMERDMASIVNRHKKEKKLLIQKVEFLNEKMEKAMHQRMTLASESTRVAPSQPDNLRMDSTHHFNIVLKSLKNQLMQTQLGYNQLRTEYLQVDSTNVRLTSEVTSLRAKHDKLRSEFTAYKVTNEKLIYSKERKIKAMSRSLLKSKNFFAKFLLKVSEFKSELSSVRKQFSHELWNIKQVYHDHILEMQTQTARIKKRMKSLVYEVRSLRRMLNTAIENQKSTKDELKRENLKWKQKVENVLDEKMYLVNQIEFLMKKVKSTKKKIRFKDKRVFN